jgi:two-component system, OmpR family, phosphate regulon response regulator PhoB
MSPPEEANAFEILIVDDDPDLRATLGEILERDALKVAAVGSGSEALAALSTHRPHLVVLDLGLPDTSGFELLRTIQQQYRLPVIVLTARDDLSDRVTGLRLGADDYVTKPFAPQELAARVAAVLRRTTAPQHDAATFGRLRIDRHARKVDVAGQAVTLTRREFDLLAELCGQPGRVFSHEQLLRSVWGSSTDWQVSATVTEHIHRLRRKLEEDPTQPRHIVTVRGVGYRFEP